MKDKIITLTTNTFQHVSILQSLLEAEGIECILQNTNVIEGAVNGSVKIRIKESDLERAMKLMETIEEPGIEKMVTQKSVKSGKSRILLPIDFSDYSEKAANIALDWAMRLNAEIMVLNVYFNPIVNTLPFSDAYIYDSSMEEMVVDMEQQAVTNMNDFMHRFRKKKEQLGGETLKIRKKLIRGVAEDEIIHFSDDYQPTVIIMGTRGKDRKAADLIGSVTAEVMEKARVPVLAVPEDFEYNGIDNIKNLMYATAFEESDFMALEKLEKIVRPLDVKIFFVHVGLGDNEKWDRLKLDGLKKFMQKQFPKLNVACDLIDCEDFWVGLEGYIQRQNIDIISFTSKRRNLLARLINPSLGKKMLFHTNTPMLVFHA